jgi:hypothetical protein
MQPRDAAGVGPVRSEVARAGLKPTAPRAPIVWRGRCADGLAVQPFDKDDLVSFAHRLEMRQTANPLDQIHLLLEKASPAGCLGRFSAESIWERIFAHGETSHLSVNHTDGEKELDQTCWPFLVPTPALGRCWGWFGESAGDAFHVTV